ncbi:ribosomal protein L1p/L10e family-domain-containing protein [Cyathus striatus]|nr:ribosomal protein L1p/L10e family-domain-containing protein [Cyathus striatus]
MPTDELIDSHVSLQQCKRAVEALHTHESKKQRQLEETQLLTGKEPYIWLNVTMKSVSPTQKFKPCKIPVVHPIVDPRTSPVCLITKDPQRQYKDLLESNGIKFISRVVGIEKLKGKFKAYEARRVLLKEYDLFLADERVVPLLPKLLGTKFFAAKKQPIPVCLTRKGVKGELERAISSSYMSQNQGTCTAVKVARLGHTPAQILDNIKAAIPSIIKHVKGGWENIQSFQLKTSTSVSLPLWNCTLDDSEEGRWHGLTTGGDEEVSGESGSEDEAAMKVDSQKAGSLKKNKRSSGEEEDEAEKPRKKAKGISSDATTASSAPTESKQPKVPTPATSTLQSPKAAKAGVDGHAKTKKGKASESVQNGSPTAAVSTTISASSIEASKSKGKKSKVAVSSADEPLDEGVGKKAETAPTSSKDNKKRKQKIDASSVPVAVAIPLSKDKSKKEEKNGAKTVDDSKTAIKAADVSVSKDELKQKRGAVVGEKKKEKTVKSKGGKSAKQGILGKKVAQG